MRQTNNKNEMNFDKLILIIFFSFHSSESDDSNTTDFEWLIWMACQPVQSYFMSRG